MSAETRRVDISIRVAQGTPVEGLDDAVGLTVARLFADLLVEAEVNVEIRESKLRAPDVELFVDGRPCPTPRLSRRPDETLRSRLVDLVHANPDAFVTQSVVEHLWRLGVAGLDPTSIPPPAFTAVLRKRARHRLALHRDAVPLLWQAAQPLEAFEDALCEATRSVRMELHPDTHAWLAPAVTDASDDFATMADGMFYELGINAGTCVMVVDDDVPPGHVRIVINDVGTPPRPLLANGQGLVSDTVEHLILTVAGEIRAAAPAMLTRDLVAFYLDNLEGSFPVLVDRARKTFSLNVLTGILRALLDEEISIRDLPFILDALLQLPPVTALDIDKHIVFTNTRLGILPELPLVGSPEQVTIARAAEFVRIALKRYISHKYTRGRNTLVVYLLDSGIEERLSDPRPFTESEVEDLRRAVSAEVGDLPPAPATPALLTTSTARRRARELLRGVFPQLPVLSYHELSPDMNIQAIARISIEHRIELPYDEVDRLIEELRLARAHAQLIAMSATEWPLHRLRERMAELLFVWNEAGIREEVARNLACWVERGLAPTGSEAAWRAAQDAPTQAAVRELLAAFDPTGARRLAAKYLIAEEELVRVERGAVPFLLARTPVTWSQYGLYLAASGRPIPRKSARGSCPAIGVRWGEALDYCAWLNRRFGLDEANGYRLPTEAEWELAARRGSSEVGDARAAMPVRQRAPNLLGLYDMCGGAAEWCSDWYDDTRTSHVLRGGDPTGLGSELACEVSARHEGGEAVEKHRSANVGFRLARTAAPVEVTPVPRFRP